MCNKGRRQSPVNIDPTKLLFDPHLHKLHIDKHKVSPFHRKKVVSLLIIHFTQVSGTLFNTGQSLVFRVDKDTKNHVNITGGPLDYRYQFEEIYIHYGTDDGQGSEHHVNGYSFPGEVSTSSSNFSTLHSKRRIFRSNYMALTKNCIIICPRRSTSHKAL